MKTDSPRRFRLPGPFDWARRGEFHSETTEANSAGWQLYARARGWLRR